MARTMSDLPGISGKWYTVSFHEPTQMMKIIAKKSSFYMFAPIVSACDQPDKRDVAGKLSDFQVRKKGQATILTFIEKSALWDRKKYTIEFHPKTIKYYYEVFGAGDVSRAYFFRSWFQDPRTVEFEMGVAPGYDTVFSPAVNFMGKDYHFTGDTSTITVGNDPTYWGSGLTGAPFCFGLNNRGDDLWVWAGLGVTAGNYTFEEFTHNSNVTKRIYGAGGFDCNYNGKMRIEGSWKSPHMILGVSDDPYSGLEDYVQTLEKDYGLKLPRKRSVPDWWKSPIFCGWGEQMSLQFKEHGNLEGGDNGQYATQKLHDEWLEIFRKHKIRPGQIIIDAGWEAPKTQGDMVVREERWPDLRGWIDARHDEGIRTILWINAWVRDGVPDDECMTKDGKPFNIDPSNPKFEKRLRGMIRRLLSSDAGCYNAAGVKIDGGINCPIGPGLKNYGNLWGMELHRHYTWIIRDEAKKHKPDALIGTFAANPYVADLSDVVRTADMFSIKATPHDTMFHRARLIAITQPGCPIDTDHTFWYDIRDNWIDIMPAQLEVPGGVPCLYHAKYAWHKRPFTRPYIEEITDQQYKVIRKVFDTQWKRIEGKGKAGKK